jgi:hypothetical protein
VGGVEELQHLIQRRRRHLLTTLRGRRGIDGRAAGDEAPPPGLLECLAQDRVAHPHCADRQASTGQVAVEHVEVDRPQSPDLAPTERRADVRVGDPLVARKGRRLDRMTLHGEPPVEKLVQRHRRAGHEPPPVDLDEQPGQLPLGLPT